MSVTTINNNNHHNNIGNARDLAQCALFYGYSFAA